MKEKRKKDSEYRLTKNKHNNSQPESPILVYCLKASILKMPRTQTQQLFVVYSAVCLLPKL